MSSTEDALRARLVAKFKSKSLGRYRKKRSRLETKADAKENQRLGLDASDGRQEPSSSRVKKWKKEINDGNPGKESSSQGSSSRVCNPTEEECFLSKDKAHRKASASLPSKAPSDEKDVGPSPDTRETISSVKDDSCLPDVVEDPKKGARLMCPCSRHVPQSLGKHKKIPLAKAIQECTILWRREYKREANQGDSTSTTVLGQMHLVGYGGLKRDVKKAFRYLNWAAKNGNSTALSLLTQLKSQGITPSTPPEHLPFCLDTFAVSGKISENGTLLPLLQDTAADPRDEGNKTQMCYQNLLKY